MTDPSLSLTFKNSQSTLALQWLKRNNPADFIKFKTQTSRSVDVCPDQPSTNQSNDLLPTSQPTYQGYSTKILDGTINIAWMSWALNTAKSVFQMRDSPHANSFW